MQPATRSGGGSASRTVDREKLLRREVSHPHLDIVRRHAVLKQFNSEHLSLSGVCGGLFASAGGSKSRLEAMLKPPLQGGRQLGPSSRIRSSHRSVACYPRAAAPQTTPSSSAS